MTTNACDADSLLPPRKRLLAGFKKQNSDGSSSSTSYSNGSSSVSTDVQTHLDNLLTSHLNDDDNHGRSPEELAQESKATAALATKIAKAARAAANEKAIVAAKAVAAAKSALELFASFPAAETVKERSPRKNKQKKHVPVHVLYTKPVGDEELARRLDRAIDNSPRVLAGCRNKKQKSVASSTMYDGNDVAGVVDSDTSTDDEVVNRKVLLRDDDNALKEKTRDESGSSLGRRRGRVKLKKLPLSMCTSKDQENGIITKSPLAGSVVNPLAQKEGSNGGVGQVRS